MLQNIENFLTTLFEFITLPVKYAIQGIESIKNLFVDTTNTVNKNANLLINKVGTNTGIMIDKAVENHGDELLKYGAEIGKLYTGTKFIDLYKLIEKNPTSTLTSKP